MVQAGLGSVYRASARFYLAHRSETSCSPLRRLIVAERLALLFEVIRYPASGYLQSARPTLAFSVSWITSLNYSHFPTLGSASVVFCHTNPSLLLRLRRLQEFLLLPVPSLPRSLCLPIEGFAFVFSNKGSGLVLDEVSEQLLRSLSRFGPAG